MYSAGILPYTIYNNKIYFLLGEETHDKTWSDFGGHEKKRDKKCSLKTAFREFIEETNNSIPMSFKTFEDMSKITIISKTMKLYPYYMYIIYLDYKYINIYKFKRNANNNTNINVYHEKSRIKWVCRNRIINTIHNNDSLLNINLRSVFFLTIKNNIDIILNL